MPSSSVIYLLLAPPPLTCQTPFAHLLCWDLSSGWCELEPQVRHLRSLVSVYLHVPSSVLDKHHLWYLACFPQPFCGILTLIAQVDLLQRISAPSSSRDLRDWMSTPFIWNHELSVVSFLTCLFLKYLFLIADSWWEAWRQGLWRILFRAWIWVVSHSLRDSVIMLPGQSFHCARHWRTLWTE